jgi:hypothetical protein
LSSPRPPSATPATAPTSSGASARSACLAGCWRAKRKRGWPATGVISSIIDADGIVGDLGGGSLELVDVAGGATGPAFSLPLGALRAEADESGERAARKLLRSALKENEMRDAAGGARSIWSAAHGAALPRRT